MLINRKTAIAYICLGELLNLPENESLSAREIAEKFYISWDTTCKVMQALNGKGYIRSILGSRGGYVANTKQLKESKPSEILRLFNKTEFGLILESTDKIQKEVIEDIIEMFDMQHASCSLKDYCENLWGIL